jgi:hypothetical protein
MEFVRNGANVEISNQVSHDYSSRASRINDPSIAIPAHLVGIVELFLFMYVIELEWWQVD